MRRLTGVLARGVRRVMARADAAMNRLYGWRHNPLYMSGTLAAVSLAVVLVTGIYLLLFYRIGAPYASVARITDQVWAGRWIRSLHRFASDAAVLAAAVHALRLFVQDRSWGPRALAWVSGLVLLFSIFVCGWTGYVMVWDVQGELLAREGARFFDLLPLFSEPIGRAFAGDRAIPGAFFFLNLFLHVALPIGVGLLLWIHVSRVARPAILPPRGLTWGVTGILTALAVVWPVAMAPAADLFRVAGRAPFDAFYSFWLPVVRPLPAGAAWALVIVVSAVALGAPLWARPRKAARQLPSTVDERLCTGCEQCYLDCPYEAIAMIARTDDRPTLVAHVDPDLCTSCGICAGSCAPMGVGPPLRTGRDQLELASSFVAERQSGARDVVIIACGRGAGGVGALESVEGAPVHAVQCAGNLHSSVVEYLVRSGVGGVLVVSCPPRDCWNREGAKWLEARLYHDREAELKARVDRRRVRLLYAAEGERHAVLAELAQFRAAVATLDAAAGEKDIDLSALCEPVHDGAAP